MKNAFTLVELLVVIAVLAFLGAIILIVFTNSLRGNNKSQILAVIKQNGQSVLETMDKTIRNSDNMVCVTLDNKSIVVVKNGIYTRYTFANGFIQQDTPTKQPDPATYKEETSPTFKDRVCANNDSVVNPINPVILTDTNPQTGVSIDCVANDCANNPIFKPDKSAGYKDKVTIQFVVNPGLQAPAAVAGQIDPVIFQTTVELR